MLVELNSHDRRLGRGRRVVPRAPPAGMEGLVSARRARSRTRPRSSGSGRPTFGKGLPDTELSLACQAISLALDDAGIAPSEVDGLASFTMEPNREVDVARARRARRHHVLLAGRLRRRGCGVVGQAAMAVATGQAETAIVSPAWSRPSASASSTIFSAMRSFDDPPGFWPSSLAKMRTSGFGESSWMPTSGVLPMRPRTSS